MGCNIDYNALERNSYPEEKKPASINHPIEALLWLLPGRRSQAMLRKSSPTRWTIVREHFGGAYEMQYQGADHALVDRDAVMLLIDFRLIEGTRYWGYTSGIEYTINRRGEEWLYDAIPHPNDPPNPAPEPKVK